MHALLRFAGNLLSDATKGRIEYHIRPHLAERFGGPLNGQLRRLGVVTELLRAGVPRIIVETGTYRGSTTHWLAMNSSARLFSVEAAPRNFGFAERRLRRCKNAHLSLGDSRDFIGRLKPSAEAVFCYLDAHWQEDLPLGDEVRLILDRFPQCVIMVDDFQVPGDPGYGFDNYGPGKSLTLADFPFDRDSRLAVHFPACRAGDETGHRRGYVVLSVRTMAKKVSLLTTLRRHRA